MSNSEWGTQSSGRIRQLQCLGIRCVLSKRNMVPTLLSLPMKPQETMEKGQLNVVIEEEEDRDLTGRRCEDGIQGSRRTMSWVRTRGLKV